MTDREKLLSELEDLPETRIPEILEFVRAVGARENGGALDTALASEKALAKDWLRPEEDEAWSDL